MKILFVSLFLLCNFKNTMGQFYFGLSRNNKTYKINRVKELKVYKIKNNKDSILTRMNTYDSFGKLLSSKTYSKTNGTLTGIETCVYDNKNNLIEVTNSDGRSRTAITKSIYDEGGNELNAETIINDLVVFTVLKKYNTSNQLITILSRNYNGDSMVMNSFYNSSGLNIKSVMYDKQPDSTIYIYNYNTIGKVSSSLKKNFESETNSTYLYDSAGNRIEEKKITISRNENLLQVKNTVTTRMD